MVKRVLVTGGDGFIGSHLVKRLVDENFKVVVPFVEIVKRSYFYQNSLHRRTELVGCDVINFKGISNLMKKYKFDLIFHLAAEPLVEKAFENPLDTFRTNIMGTANVLEAARRFGKVSGILVASSDKAYGKIPRANENKPIGGDHPYEASKASADLIATTYFKTYGLPVIVTRFGNVYGEGDINFSRIIPGIMKALLKKEVLQIRSNGKYIRDYVYVKDVVEAMIMISGNFKKISGEAFNVSSFENFSVLGLIKKIEDVLGCEINYKVLGISVNEIPRQSINFNKIRKALGWKPKSNLERTIPSIYDWYKYYFGLK